MSEEADSGRQPSQGIMHDMYQMMHELKNGVKHDGVQEGIKYTKNDIKLHKSKHQIDSWLVYFK